DGLPAALPIGIRLQGLTLAKTFDPSVGSGAGVWSHPSAPFDNTDAFSTSFTVPQGADWRKRTGSTLDTFNSILEIYVDYLSIFAPLQTQFSITSVTPPSGAADGGTPVTINGSFPVASAIADAGAAAAAYAVYFGDPSASTLAQFNIAGGIAIDSASANVLTPDSGLSTDTTVGVWIVDRNATSDFASLADAFTFIGPPSSGGPVPSVGTVDGGTAVTFTGTNLATTSQVLFGSTPATQFSATATTVTATTPPADNGLPGTVTITIVTDGGSATAGQFEYVATPFISSFTPTEGVRTVQTTITVTGSELSNVISVTVAGIAAASFTEIDSGTLEVVADTSPDVLSGPIVVTTAGGTATSAENFNYLTDFDPTPPIVNSVSPDNGWVFGGMIVEIAGEAFLPQNRAKVNREDVTVTFGTYTAAVLSVTDTTIYVLAPEATNVGLPDASRTVDVTVSRNDDSGLSGTLADGFTFVKFIQRAGEDWTTTASKLGANATISMVLDGDSSQLATIEVSANTEGVKFNTDVFVLARAATSPDGFGLAPPGPDAGSNVADSFTYFDVHTYVLDPAFNTQPAGIDTNNLSSGLNILDENTGAYDSVAQKDSLLSTPIGSTNITTASQANGQVTIFGDRKGVAKTPTTLTYVWPDASIDFSAGDSEVYWSTILNGEFTAAGDSIESIDNGRLRSLGTFVVRDATVIDLDDVGLSITPQSPTEGDLGTEYVITVVSEDGGLGFLTNPRFGNNAKTITGGVGRIVTGGDGTNEFQVTIATPLSDVPVNAPVDIGLFLKANAGNQPDFVFQNVFTFNKIDDGLPILAL
ncbi:MAG: IPT/TIG domain-containing protein, partial [Candidatus Hydrogenedentota bacterium]